MTASYYDCQVQVFFLKLVIDGHIELMILL